MKYTLTFFFVLLLLATLASCRTEIPKGDTPDDTETKSEEKTMTQAETSPSYQQISPAEAHAYMESHSDFVILDVRTAEEFAEGHIPNAVLLDNEDVDAKAKVVLPSKEQVILVYCRSGRRSKLAAEKLVNLGYTNVMEFGGILDWPYEIVTE